MANGAPGDPGGGAPRTPICGFSVDGSREGAERGTSTTVGSPGGFSPAGRLEDEGTARPPGGGATATLLLGGGAAALGAVAAGPRSAEDGDGVAGSTGRLGTGTMGWGTGAAGALEAGADGAGAGVGAGAGAAAIAGPDGIAGGDGRATGRSSTPGTGRARAGPEDEAGGRAGGAVVTPLDAVPADPPAGVCWLSASFASGGGDLRGRSGLDGGHGTSVGGDAIRSC